MFLMFLTFVMSLEPNLNAQNSTDDCWGGIRRIVRRSLAGENRDHL
jgi:hypothetical protein